MWGLRLRVKRESVCTVRNLGPGSSSPRSLGLGESGKYFLSKENDADLFAYRLRPRGERSSSRGDVGNRPPAPAPSRTNVHAILRQFSAKPNIRKCDRAGFHAGSADTEATTSFGSTFFSDDRRDAISPSTFGCSVAGQEFSRWRLIGGQKQARPSLALTRTASRQSLSSANLPDRRESFNMVAGKILEHSSRGKATGCVFTS